MRKAITVAMVAALALCGCCGNAIQRKSEKGTVNVNRRFISNSPRDNFETVVDTETGVVYLVWIRDGGTAGAKGGITPLLDEDGKVVISEEVER